MHRIFLKRFPLFIWLLFAFVYLFLRCLVSALTQAGGGDLLFRFASSVLLRGGRGAASRYRCVWGALTVFRPHWVCPCSRVSVLSPSILLSLPAALYGPCPALRGVPVFQVLHKSADLVAPAFCAFPSLSGSGSQGLDGRTSPGAARPLPFSAPASVSAYAVACVRPV